jgi:CTP:molybdopterin cytidylyltransferase MocA
MLIAQPLIAELLAADPPSSARDVVRRYAARGVELQVQEDGPFLDVDTPEEYGRLVERLKAGA